MNNQSNNHNSSVHLPNDIWSAARNAKYAQLQKFLQTPGAVNRTRWSGTTPLHRAVEGGDLDTVNILIEAGADVNAQTTWGGYAPLHIACKYGREEIARALIDAGAKWNIFDKEKATPKSRAVRTGNASIARRLEEYHRQAMREK